MYLYNISRSFYDHSRSMYIYIYNIYIHIFIYTYMCVCLCLPALLIFVQLLEASLFWHISTRSTLKRVFLFTVLGGKRAHHTLTLHHGRSVRCIPSLPSRTVQLLILRAIPRRRHPGGRCQWSFLVPLIGGRYHIIPQLAVYTTYIPRKPETSIEDVKMMFVHHDLIIFAPQGWAPIA